MTRKHRSAIVVAALAFTVTSACGVGPEESDTASAPSSTPSSSTSGSSTPTSSATATESATGEPSSAGTDAAATDLGEPAATREASMKGFDLRLEVFAVQQSDGVATVDLRLTSTGAEQDASTNGFQVGQTFSDGDTSSSDSSSDTTDGVKLLDGANKQLHLVASDGSGQCLCTRSLNSTYVKLDASVTLSQTYAGLPEGVESVSLVVPKFGTISRVPVD